MRINVNTSAVNTHRIMTNNSKSQDKNLERLASGHKINRGADGPAALQVSERLRSQTASLGQAIDNSENAVSVLQTAEAALDEVSRALVNARQLAVHAANEGANDEFMLQADELEFQNIVGQVNRIAANTQYGKNYLLDGSRAGNGVTTGASLEFVDATSDAVSSGLGGYDVTIKTTAKRAELTGTAQLTQATIDNGEQITISEGGRTVNFKTIKG
ncbi:MAG: flagellin, partial [SAR324 cluster bacterium]|nr:flagellin [SAR324 cluster bacterium]